MTTKQAELMNAIAQLTDFQCGLIMAQIDGDKLEIHPTIGIMYSPTIRDINAVCERLDVSYYIGTTGTDSFYLRFSNL